MGVFCDRLKLFSTAALDCRNKGIYRKKELLFLLVSFCVTYTANVYTQTTDLLLFSDVVITHENV